MNTPRDEQDQQDETVGDIIDDANELMQQHVPADALARLNLDELSPELQSLIANEGGSVHDASVQQTILSQISSDEGTRNAMLGVLRFMGKAELAGKIEQACAEGTLTIEAVQGIGEALEEGGGLTEVREQLTGLLSSVRSGATPKGKATKEMRKLIKEVSGDRTIRNCAKTVGRNDSCPCGSGKKYKKCCWNKRR